MSLSMWACLQRQGNHKTMKCFFSFPPTHFSFGRAFLAHWAGGSGGSRRRLMERATWTNPVWNQAAKTARPSQIYDSPPLFSHTEAPLWSFWMYWTLSITFCHLYLPLLPLPFLSHFPISLFFYVHLSFPFLFFSILVSLSLFLPLLFSQTSWPAVHPDRVSTAVCAKLSCSSRGRSNSLQRGALSQHLCLLSSQHPWPEHDLDTTTTCFHQNHPHTLHRGSVEEVTQQKLYWINTNTIYCVIQKHMMH